MSRPRRIVECSFGTLTSVWRVLRAPLATSLETRILIAKACVCLHNYCIENDNRIYFSGASQPNNDKTRLCWEDFEESQEPLIEVNLELLQSEITFLTIL